VNVRLAVAGACALGFALGWNVTNIGAVAEPLADTYGVGLGVIGLVATAFFVTHVALQIPGGKASDRFGARLTALAGLAIAVSANALALAASLIGVAVATRLLVGIGTGIGFVAGSAYVRAVGGSPFAQGLYGGVGMGGGGAALAIVPALESSLGWRAPFLSAAIVALAALLLLLACPADRPAGRRADGGKPAGVLRDRRLRRLGVLYAASFGLSIVIGNWVVTLLERNGGLTLEQAGVVGGVTLAVGVVTRPLGGWIMRTHPARTRRAVGTSLACGALGTLALLGAEPTALAVAGALLIGIAVGIPFAPAFLGAAHTRPDAPAAAMGYVNMSGNAAAVVGTPLVGVTFALPGDGRLGFLVVAALWCVALALLPSSRELGVGPSS
jgi:MFS family permease